jgi:branched-chain amino acid transport system ATP-binding protein
MPILLEVKDFHFYYDNIHAVRGISFYVDQGELVAIVGANGAGKTTTLRAICGLLGPIKQGAVELNSQRINDTPAHEMVKLGISQVLEGRMLFPQLTVTENLMLGAFSKNWKRIDDTLDYVYELFPRLKERNKQNAGTLSGGEQQMLALGRALMTGPTLLMLDEPSLGLAPIIVEAIFEAITKIHKNGTSILLVEQNSNIALEISDRAYVFETGTIAISGVADTLRHNEEVIKSYLGGE